jgi:hypothetical protein
VSAAAGAGRRRTTVRIIELLMLGFFGVGIIMLIRVVLGETRAPSSGDRHGTERSCPRCHNLNPTHANYCARCGLRLD